MHFVDWSILVVMAVGITVVACLTRRYTQSVTDFLQGSFCNVALVIVGVYLLFGFFDWSQITEALAQAPADASLVNPMKTSGTDNFNVYYYYLIAAFVIFFTYMAWQGNQGYYCAAKTPHDAKMGRVFGSFRTLFFRYGSSSCGTTRLCPPRAAMRQTTEPSWRIRV